MNQLRTTIFRLSAGNRNVFGIMLLSAALVILIRLLGPLRIHGDLSTQLEAAYRLVEGSGLTNAFSSQFDLNQPPVSKYLTHFPPGLSLLVSAFLVFNIPLAITLKIIYSLTTVIGWLGWSVISSRCLLSPLKIGSTFLPIHLMIAIILPIFYTPPWTFQGTDIFLWAGVPIITLLLLFPSRNYLGLINTTIAGFGILLLISFRYASGFLLIAAFLVILQMEMPKIKSFLKRYTILILPSLSFTILIVIYFNWQSGIKNNKIATSTLLENHGARHLNPDLIKLIFESLEKLLSSFSNLYILTGIETNQLETIIKYNWLINNVFGIVFLCLIIYLCINLVSNDLKKNSPNFLGPSISTSLSYLLISLILFSVILVFMISYSPLIIDRYYLPIQPCLILITYKAVTLSDFNQLLKQLSMTLIIAFILYSLILRPARYFMDESRDLISLVLAAWTAQISDIRYPSNEILTFHQESLNFLTKIETQESKVLFFIQNYSLYMNYFYFDNPKKVRHIPDSSFWKNAYLSQPTRVFWVINNPQCPSICASPGGFNSDQPTAPIQQLTSLPNLEVVFTNPAEGTKIMFSDLPAGYQFAK